MEGRVFVALNGYRYDDFTPYVYMSDNYGDTWTAIGKDLPMEPLNVVKEDPVNPDILYIGTDHGLYISLDRGKHSMLMGDMPYTPVHDLVIHPRDKELVIATHGRSLYKADVSKVQALNATNTDSLTCFDEKLSINHSSRWGSRSATWRDYYEPTVTFPVYTPVAGDAVLKVYSDSLFVQEQQIKLHKGLSNYTYKLEMKEDAVDALTKQILDKEPDADPKLKKADNGMYYLPTGKYRIEIQMNNQKSIMLLDVKGKN